MTDEEWAEAMEAPAPPEITRLSQTLSEEPDRIDEALECFEECFTQARTNAMTGGGVQLWQKLSRTLEERNLL